MYMENAGWRPAGSLYRDRLDPRHGRQGRRLQPALGLRARYSITTTTLTKPIYSRTRKDD
jgi:hypothetical protein